MSAEEQALITLEALKDFLKEDGTDHDKVLGVFINSVSEEFEGYLERTLNKTLYTDLYFDGDGEVEYFLPNWPVSGTFTITEDDVVLTEGIDDDFMLYAEKGKIVRNGVWLKGYKTLKVTYTAGYETIPKDIQLACMKWCAWEFQQHKQKRWGETSRTDPDAGSVSTFRESEVWKEINRVIKKYRRVG
jgi:hypothetical protein